MSDRELVTPDQESSLADLVDRLLAGGVVVAGDVTLGIADVDLVYLDLRLLLASIQTLEGSDASREEHA